MLIATVETHQNTTAHKYVTEWLDSNAGVCNDIPATLLDPDAILEAFLAADSEDSSRGKLSIEGIKAWFELTLKDVLMAGIANKRGWLDDGYQLTAEQEKGLEQSAAGFRATLEKLSLPVPKVNIATALQLKKAVELLGESRKMDSIAMKLERKLDGIINPPVERQVSLEELL